MLPKRNVLDAAPTFPFRRNSGTLSDVFAIVVALLISLVTAVGVVLVVALPHLRSGRGILTDDGRLAVRSFRSSARSAPGSVAGGAVQLVQGAATGVQGAVRPVAEALHAQLDRLEERDRAAQAEARRSSELLSQLVGPRPVPVHSGPIPEVVTPAPPVAAPAVQPPRVIDLREPEAVRPKSGLR